MMKPLKVMQLKKYIYYIEIIEKTAKNSLIHTKFDDILVQKEEYFE